MASISVYLVPEFGVLLSTMMGEQLTRYTVGGGLVVLVSTILIMRYDSSG